MRAVYLPKREKSTALLIHWSSIHASSHNQGDTSTSYRKEGIHGELSSVRISCVDIDSSRRKFHRSRFGPLRGEFEDPADLQSSYYHSGEGRF